MSAAGDAIGAAMVANKTTAVAVFSASRKSGHYTPAEMTCLALLTAQAEGNAIADAIVAGRRIFAGTNPNPDPAQFQNGDIYFLTEA